MEHNLRNSIFFCPYSRIKGNQNGLVTFYKIFFCVQQKKVVWNDMRVRKWWQNLLSVTFQQSSSNQCFTVKCFYTWQKCIIKLVAFVVNSVIFIVLSCVIYSFIYSNWRPYDPSPQTLFDTLFGPTAKFSAQGPEFLATALSTRRNQFKHSQAFPIYMKTMQKAYTILCFILDFTIMKKK